jgi:hypothetical protein
LLIYDGNHLFDDLFICCQSDLISLIQSIGEVVDIFYLVQILEEELGIIHIYSFTYLKIAY